MECMTPTKVFWPWQRKRNQLIWMTGIITFSQYQSNGELEGVKADVAEVEVEAEAEEVTMDIKMVE